MSWKVRAEALFSPQVLFVLLIEMGLSLFQPLCDPFQIFCSFSVLTGFLYLLLLADDPVSSSKIIKKNT